MQPFIINSLSILQKSVYSLSNQFFIQFMKFDFTYWSAFLLIFFVHLIVFAFLSWQRGYSQERLSDKMLGCLLFLGARGWWDLRGGMMAIMLFITAKFFLHDCPKILPHEW